MYQTLINSNRCVGVEAWVECIHAAQGTGMTGGEREGEDGSGAVNITV